MVSTVKIELDQIALNAVLTSLDQQAKALVAVGTAITAQAKAQVDAEAAAAQKKAAKASKAKV